MRWINRIYTFPSIKCLLHRNLPARHTLNTVMHEARNVLKIKVNQFKESIKETKTT